MANVSRMYRSSATSEKNPAGRSRSAAASMSGTEPRTAVIAFLLTAQSSRPNRPGGVAERVRGVHGAAPEVQRVLEILVDDPVNLRGPDAVGEEAGHDGARATADVDIEVAGAVEPLFDRGDHADLVHAPDDAADPPGPVRSEAVATASARLRA